MAMSEDDFCRVIDTNLKGTFNCIRHVARQMLKQKSGRIVNMASIVGIGGNPGQANYAASKAGVIGLTKTAAKELASRGITVNAVAPGFIRTDMTDVLSDKVKEETLKNIPMGTYGEPEDVAKAVVFLASPEARYITGQVLCVRWRNVMSKRRVVVTGLGAVTPVGNNVQAFWESVKTGKVGIGEITRFDTADLR